MSSQQLNAFEVGDLRRNNWVDSVIVGSNVYHFPFKYKSATFGDPISEYLIVFRLAEQYLIRAEAKAQLDKLPSALEDLNVIRLRAGLSQLNLDNQESILKSILQERRVELFSEGHRWFDLKRTKMIDEVMMQVCAVKGGSWESRDQYNPIPVAEIQLNPNLIQTPGY